MPVSMSQVASDTEPGRPVPPPFTFVVDDRTFTTTDPSVTAEVTALIASGQIRPDEADDAAFLITSGRALDAWAADLGLAAAR